MTFNSNKKRLYVEKRDGNYREALFGRKVIAAGVADIIAAIILFILNTAGVEVPAEVASAILVIITFIVSFFTDPAPTEVILRRDSVHLNRN